jgi:transposase
MKCFRMRGKKGVEHFDPLDPPRCRGNKRRGRGTFANDRPPVLGTIGRESGQIRLRVVKDTQQTTLCEHVEHFTSPATQLYTDEHDSYNNLDRSRSTVTHGLREWARDDDGDGIREVHTNTAEGMWSGLRTFLRPFRGVSKHSLSGYVAIYEFRVNRKRVSVSFIASLIRSHYFYP